MFSWCNMRKANQRSEPQKTMPVAVRSRTDETGVSSDRRIAARYGTSHNAAWEIGGVRYIVEVSDVSRAGARVRIRNGLLPMVAQTAFLCFMNQMVVEAVVVWIENDCAGLQFVGELPEEFDLMHFDEMGAEYFGTILKFQIAGARD